MSSPRSLPSMVRVALLVTGLGIRRTRNRFFAVFAKKSAAGAREGVGRKRSMGGAVLPSFIAVILILLVTSLTSRFTTHVARDAERHLSSATLPVSRYLMLDLQERSGEQLHRAFRLEATEMLYTGAEADRYAELLQRQYEEHGAAGFRESRLPGLNLFPSSALWIPENDSRDMLLPIGLLTLLLLVSPLFAILASSFQDLARADSSFEWWFTMPVSAQGLLLARIVETAFASPFIWVALTPYFATVFICAGLGYAAIPLALVSAAYIGLILGSIRVALETTLRRTFSTRTMGRLEALCQVLRFAVLVPMGAAMSPDLREVLIATSHRLPSFLLTHPFTPLEFAAGGSRALRAALGCSFTALALPFFAATLGGWMLRDGLIDQTGPSAGPRTPTREPSRDFRFGAIARKELHLLFRNRALYMQVFISPVVLVGTQLLVNRRLVGSLAENPNHAATTAFSVSAFLIGLTATRALANEGSALWIYSTVPVPMFRVLVHKAAFWTALGALVMTAIFTATSQGSAFLSASGTVAFALALVGIVLSMFLAVGIGTLATDPFEIEPQRRVRVSMVYLYLGVANLFAHAIYAPSIWTKFVQVVLTTVLVFAVWQKVREHMPFLLDPIEAPPPSIAVADGLIAALSFFVLQGLFILSLAALGYSPGASVLYGFSAAGLITFGGALFVFWRNRLPDFARVLGLVRPPSGVLRAALLGIAGGLACGVFGAAYLYGISHIDFLEQLRRDTVSFGPERTSSDILIWYSILAIVAAPLCEEFIFRGVLYRGFRHSFSTKWAALASALVFALVHPAIGVVPVLALGLVTALIYERSRSLLAPIATHMTYNAIVVWMAANVTF